MLSHRMLRRGAVATSTLIVVAVVPALAGKPRAPGRVSLTAIDRPAFKPNRYLGDGLRWSRDATTMRSGGTLTLANKTREAHAFSIVRRSQVPSTASQADNCEVCRPITDAHDFSAGPPRVAIVDKDGRGFNQPGDSAAFLEGPMRMKITARPGQTLHYICAVHAWMQGTIAVKK